MLPELNLTPDEEQQMMGQGVTEPAPGEPSHSVEPAEIKTEPTIESGNQEPQPDDRKVPLAALHEARAEIKELRKQFQDANIKLSAVEQLKQDIIALRESRRELPPVIPNFDEDPLGNLSHRVIEQERKISSYDTDTKQRNQALEAQRQHNNLVNNVAYQEQEFQKTSPDYLDAVQYMREFRKNELAMFGITDPHQITEEIRKNTIALASFAVSQNKNPAEIMYTLAKQYGYKSKSHETVPATIETVSKGESNASKTLSGKGITEGNLTAESLVNLEGAEFDAAWKKLFG